MIWPYYVGAETQVYDLGIGCKVFLRELQEEAILTRLVGVRIRGVGRGILTRPANSIKKSQARRTPLPPRPWKASSPAADSSNPPWPKKGLAKYSVIVYTIPQAHHGRPQPVFAVGEIR